MLNYLAYGSNLHPLRLLKRVPSVQIQGTVSLEEYKVTFSKRSQDQSSKCNLVHTGDPADIAYGAVYYLRVEEKPQLDEVEGLGYGYMEQSFEVELNNEILHVFSYVAMSSHIESRLQPYDWYKSIVVEGAKYHRFPDTYISELEAITCKRDENIGRRERNYELVLQLQNFVDNGE